VFAHRLLGFNGGADRVHNAGKFRQHAVAHQLENTPVMFGNFRVDQGRAHRLKRGKRAFLIRADKARIANNIRGQNSGETAFH
jgi:hypothetical protein